MKQSAKTAAASPPASRPALMFLRAVSRSTGGFLSRAEGEESLGFAPAALVSLDQTLAAIAIERKSRAR